MYLTPLTFQNIKDTKSDSKQIMHKIRALNIVHSWLHQFSQDFQKNQAHEEIQWIFVCLIFIQ